jgi:hypothetical protein
VWNNLWCHLDRRGTARGKLQVDVCDEERILSATPEWIREDLQTCTWQGSLRMKASL